jgi:predicted RNase H-like HicB family nuclease
MYITNMKTAGKTLQGLVWKEGKYYVSQCLNVDVSSFGNTKLQAIENLKEALELYFEDDMEMKGIQSIESPELVPMVLYA